MAYSEQKHRNFSGRMKNFFVSIQNNRDELAKLVEIYTNETESGVDPAFVDTDNATKQEHIDGIVFMQALEAFCEGGVVATLDRRSNITAFTQ